MAWIYFTGTDNFIYLYPWVPSSQFRFDPVIYSKAYWQEAMARHPHLEHAMLSRPYQDFCRTGADDHPLPAHYPGRPGSLACSASTSRPSRWRRPCTASPPDWHPVPAQRPSADPRQQPVRYRAAPVRTAQSAEYEWQQGALQLVYPIPETPLSLIHRIPLLPLLQTLLWQSATALITILCLVVATVSSLRAQRLNRRLNYLSRHDA